jgi:ABC-type Fe3+/spermidine/putrescine transport system ATPase subunit
MLEIRNLYKDYDNQPLLKGISLSIQPGETVCLLGPSGSGKSTMLRLIAGLEMPKSGDILWEGTSILQTAVHKRNFGFMFQDYALFPHQNVFQNVAFGLRMQKFPDDLIREKVEQALEQVNMLGFAQRRVTDLSGGEQQRVALARALAPNPRLLMLDEPLGALDRDLRDQLTQELRRILHETGIPAIYVTHDQEEAFKIADRLILLRDGQIIQSGSPEAVYRHPVSTWVARFLGLTNILTGQVINTKPLEVETPNGVFRIDNCGGQAYKIGQALSLLLPMRCWFAEQSQKYNILHGTAADVIFRGEGYRLELKCENQCFNFNVDTITERNQEVILAFDPESIIILEKNHAA